jgi:hypothetical protein
MTTIPEPVTDHVPVSSTSRITEEILPKIPFFGRIKDIGYSVGVSQYAVGVMSAVYIVIWQGTYWGFSLKPYWDGANNYLHFKAIPWTGPFLYDNWDIGRHLFFRDALESVLAYALVVMVIVKIKPLYAPGLGYKIRRRLGLAKPWDPSRRKIPLVHQVLGFCHMPTPYQGDMIRWLHRPGRVRRTRSAQTTPLQYLMLLPSMFLASVPGMAVMAAIVYGGMAYAHHRGYHSPWLTPESPWVPIAVGVAGGNAFGHLPAVKAGQDVQKYFLRMRLAVAYFAEELLRRHHDDEITLDQARDEITALRSTKPGKLYPDVYRARYDLLKSRNEPADRGTRLEIFSVLAFVFVVTLLAGYGLYARKWAIPHNNLWIP